MEGEIDKLSDKQFDEMKVGIITFEFNYNYGAILQATALLDFLRQNGHNPLIINNGWGGVKRTDQHVSVIGLIGKFIGRFWSNKHLLDFKKRHWDMSSPVDENTQLRSVISDLDAIVTGSDQIWNSACIGANGLYYYGYDALPTQRLIAYAPSFGKNRFEAPEEVIEKLKNHFRRFKAISVREDDGIQILKNVFGFENAKKVLDPTMLMGIDYYKRLMRRDKLCQRKTLAYYILDNNPQKEKWVEAFSSKMGLKPVNINRPEYNGASIIGKVRALRYPSIESWLRNIAESEFVITDSFHGSVFSIIFNRQFLTFGNKERGNSRFDSLLSMFDLNNRMIVDPENIVYPSQEIDYSEVNKLIDKRRVESSEFLLQALL